MARRIKRSRGLGGTEFAHAKRAKVAGTTALADLRDAVTAANSGKCSDAISLAIYGSLKMGDFQSNESEVGAGAPSAELQVLRQLRDDIQDAFKQVGAVVPKKCVAKKGK